MSTEQQLTSTHEIENLPTQNVDMASTSQEWSSEEESVNLKNESERLKTFDTWPVKFLDRRKLTAAGFYYLKNSDRVRCAFCGVEIGEWKNNDDPMTEHSIWSKNCQFINKAQVGNIPLSTTDDNDNHRTSRVADIGFETCGPLGIPVLPGSRNPFVGRQIQSSRNSLPLGQSLQNQNDANTCSQDTFSTNPPEIFDSPNFLRMRPPSFPDYATPESRMRSYDSWPISLKLKPNVLTEAGFFYTGKGDQTICYHCGGGLKDWEETDEPWVEHARWFSKCPFVLSIKGKEFVDEVCGKKASEDLKNSQSGVVLSSSTSELEKIQNLNLVECYKPKLEPPEDGSEGSSGIGSRSSSRGSSSDVLLCKICYTDEVGAVFLPCGHMMACMKCAVSLTSCAICRKPVSAFFRAFFS